MILPYRMEIEFGEISVFSIGHEAPCHDWTGDYAAQGFCWLKTQIAFLTLLREGVLEVTVQIEDEVVLRPDALRAIQAPIFVAEDSPLGIWPNSSVWFEIPEGEYCLVYQTGLKPVILESQKKQGDYTVEWYDMWCVLTFVRQDNAEAKILRQDEKLSPAASLFTTDKSHKWPIQLTAQQGMELGIWYDPSPTEEK